MAYEMKSLHSMTVLKGLSSIVSWALPEGWGLPQL
jgi:hypothetical protein